MHGSSIAREWTMSGAIAPEFNPWVQSLFGQPIA
jgi:hypothetical protein